eukprot:scaffold8250_cov239-Pinguiococcus_pyrenoidosus.AAC.2
MGYLAPSDGFGDVANDLGVQQIGVARDERAAVERQRIEPVAQVPRQRHPGARSAGGGLSCGKVRLCGRRRAFRAL